ncbi:hypothetical protein GC175_14055 [bacterium]|nr:hypothetical protein [bacterium]
MQGWAAVGLSLRLGWRVGGVLCRKDVVSAQACPGAGWAAVGVSSRLGWWAAASSAARTLSARRRVLARGGRRWDCPRDWGGGRRCPLPRGRCQRADVSWRGVGDGGVVLAIGVVVGGVLCREDVLSAQACPGAG